MMHNSLYLRELLRARNQTPLARRRRDPHRYVRYEGIHRVGAGQVALEGTWKLTGEPGIFGMDEALADLKDFLDRLHVTVDDTVNNTIALRHDPTIAVGSCRTSVRAGSVEISAPDSQGLWAGIAHLEREMAQHHAPILAAQIVEHTPAWPIQISQAPYAANYLVPDLGPEYLGDDAFRLLAHYGINGMTIYGDWLCYVQSERFPELNNGDYEKNIAVLRDAVERGARYGVKLYFVPVSPKLAHDHPLFQRLPEIRGAKIGTASPMAQKQIHCLCSSNPQSLAFHGEVMADLFRQAPGLGGLILIIGGESYYHCYMRADRTGFTGDVKRQTNCPRCSSYPPEAIVNGLLAATASAVHSVQPQAPIMAWPYSAYAAWSNDPAQINLIEEMASDVALLSTIDKDQLMQKNGYKKKIWDYSIDYTGPQEHILAQAEAVRQQDLALYVKTETALGLECIQFPYMPALPRLHEKWRHVASLHPDGVLQSWMFFGMWGSRAEELGWWQAWQPELSTEAVLRRMAERDFGRHADAVLAAWTSVSEAVAHLPYIGVYFTGPEFIGPAHPLIFEPLSEEDHHQFDALLYYLQESEETFSHITTEVYRSLYFERLPLRHIAAVTQVDGSRSLEQVIEEEYAQAVDHSEKAYRTLAALVQDRDAGSNEALHEETNLCELVYRTFRSTHNTIRFLLWKEHYEASGTADSYEEMIAIARDELANTQASRHIFVESPWLDLADRIDGRFPSSLAMIDTKIRLLEAHL